MRIDSHQHFWKYEPQRHAWITDKMKRIRRDFLPQHLEPVLQENQIDACVAVQADQTEEETRFLLDLAAGNPFIKGVVGWLDLKQANVASKLEAYTANPLFKGLRHIVQAEPKGFMLSNNFREGVSKLGAFNLTYDILIYPSQLADAVQLARALPNQRFVLDHMAKPAISEGLNKYWLDGIKQLANLDNVYCKVSGLVTEAVDFKWRQEELNPFLDAVTTAFGTKRLLFGSDWPVCLVAAEYEAVLSTLTNFYSTSELEPILGINAQVIYNL